MKYSKMLHIISWESSLARNSGLLMSLRNISHFNEGNKLAGIYSPQSGLIVKDEAALRNFEKEHGKLPI